MGELRVLRIFCLSLDKDVHRRDLMMNSFPILKDRIEFIPGLDGSQSPVKLPSWTFELNNHEKYDDHIRSSISALNHNLSNKELACVLGHMNIWKVISESKGNQPYLICEDDIHPKDEASFIEQTNNIISEMTTHDIVYLGYSSFQDQKRRCKLYTAMQRAWHWCKQRRYSGTLQSIVSYNLVRKASPRISLTKRHVLHAGQHWGAFCYLVTPDAARQLLALNANLSMTSDGTLRYANLSQAIPLYISKTSLVRVNSNLGSNIRTQEEHDSNFSKFKIT